ncbi:hypothetical protein HJFPF1_09375 [Paramyrothecium foliicola]|nr:hypothetical protein HJFPF1_09375 [Paramyrothecium foliicola]
MLTTAASRLPPRARVLQAPSSALTKSIATTTCSVQQCRTFRNAGPSHAETLRDARRRHRTSRYKHMESVSQTLSWETQPRSDANKAALKEAMAESIKSSSTDNTGKYVNVDEIKSWSDDVSGVRPGRNIEDVERDAMNHLLRRDPSGPSVLLSSMQSIRNLIQSHRAPKEVTPEEVLRATAPAEEAGSFIDPITNRRVLQTFTPKYEDLDQYGPVKDVQSRVPPTNETLVQDAQKYQSTQFSEPEGLPKFSAEEKSKEYKDLHKYSPTNFDRPDKARILTAEEKSKNYDDLQEYQPVTWNEPDGLPKATPEEESKNYSDLHKYSAVQIDNPAAPQKLTPEEASKLYDDLHLYGAVRWNEPDGLLKLTAEEQSKNYTDLDQYGPVQWHEPDGLRPLTAEEKSKDYQDLSSYGPVAWSEPDGLRQLTPEEQSKQYDDLNAYSEGFTVKDSVLAAHEAAQMDPTPKAEPLAARVDAPIEDKSQEYKDLDKYGPVRWNEPDGLRKLTPEELSKDYADLHLYGGATKWNEPDGLRPLTAEEKSKQYGDLRAYAPTGKSGPEVVPSRRHPEEASKDYEDLPEYAQYDNGDAATPRIHPEEASKQYDDLKEYSQYDNTGPEIERVHPEEASKDYEDLSKYPAQGYEEPNETSRAHPEEETKEYKDLDKYSPRKFDSFDQVYPVEPESNKPAYEDLGKYNPQKFDSINKGYPTHPEEATKAYPDLHLYQGIGRNKPFGKIVEFPDPLTNRTKPYQAKPPSQERIMSPPASPWEQDLFRGVAADPLDSLTPEVIRARVLRRAWERNQRENLDQQAADRQSAKVASAQDVVNMGRQGSEAGERELTGNFIRDFPEEFTDSWGDIYSPSGTSLRPKGSDGGANRSSTASTTLDVEDELHPSSMDESFPVETSKLEPALRRMPIKNDLDAQERARLNADPYSTAPQGLQTSYAEECGGRATWPTMVRHYSAKAAPKEMSNEAGEQSAESPMSYRILAYDSASQSVAVAETSSSVVDLSSPATPADVLSRLSNPSKFLPHFRSLEMQGYEIFSGSGDVLVFRKVRPASVGWAADNVAADTAYRQPMRVNPIDMMGYPVTGNFASPTGFVNYDTLSDDAVDKPIPPYRSSTNVRREEPRVSGRSTSPGEGGKKRGIGRKIALTTVGVAGVAYAASVTEKFFSTGVVDTRGMRRL